MKKLLVLALALFTQLAVAQTIDVTKPLKVGTFTYSNKSFDTQHNVWERFYHVDLDQGELLLTS